MPDKDNSERIVSAVWDIEHPNFDREKSLDELFAVARQQVAAFPGVDVHIQIRHLTPMQRLRIKEIMEGRS